MSEPQAPEPVYWPRVKAILDDIMARWIERWGRDPYPGIHEYYWDNAPTARRSRALRPPRYRAGCAGPRHAPGALPGARRRRVWQNAAQWAVSVQVGSR